MKLSEQSNNSVIGVIKKAMKNYLNQESSSQVTDIFLQPLPDTGELIVYNDDDEILAQTLIPEWVNPVTEDFYGSTEIILKGALAELQKQGFIESVNLFKPYSFVLVDEDKETVSDLLLVDDETLVVNDGLLKGLDEELDAFLKELLEK